MSLRRSLTLFLIPIAAACTGAIDDMAPGETPGPSAAPPRDPAPDPGAGAALPPVMPGVPLPGTMTPPSQQTAEACKSLSPGPAPIRRLTRFEYANTVRDLLGVTESPSLAFAPDAHALGFDNIAAAQTVSRLQVEQYEDAARGLAATALQDLPRLLGCDPAAMGEDACARRFIADFGRRAYRRPLATTERDRLVAFYSGQKAKHGFLAAVEQVLTVMLQSPHFLYRPEFGVPSTAQNGVVRLTQHEVASRLSYLVWASMPDEALLAAADAGKLGTPQEIAAQAERMLAESKARAAVRHFHRQWLELEEIDNVTKDAKVYPTFTPTLRTHMKRETDTFLEDLVFRGDGLLATLLTADHTFANRTLAAFYGATGPTSDSSFVKVKLPAGQRSGFLTHASFLSVHAKPNQSSPIDRGKFIRERLFCQDLPPPPNDVEVVPPELKPGQTTRQRFKIHNENPACGGCHSLIDPVGFGLEHYDGIGAWRELDQGQPVDASGEIVGTDVEGPYRGALELTAKLARSDQVRSCVVTQWFRYGYGREELASDSCSLGLLKDQFRGSGHNLRKLIVALTQTPAFLYRSTQTGGTP